MTWLDSLALKYEVKETNKWTWDITRYFPVMPLKLLPVPGTQLIYSTGSLASKYEHQVSPLQMGSFAILYQFVLIGPSWELISSYCWYPKPRTKGSKQSPALFKSRTNYSKNMAKYAIIREDADSQITSEILACILWLYFLSELDSMINISWYLSQIRKSLSALTASITFE